MSKYRKLPVVIEAYQLGVGDNVPDWFMDALTKCDIITLDTVEYSPFYLGHRPGIQARVRTLEGTMVAGYKDYIIRGVKGELYPCKEDVFKLTYEKVGDA